jgi:hypothetical protein
VAQIVRRAPLARRGVVLLLVEGTTGIQVFATHYLDASLSIAAFVQPSASKDTYFVYLQSVDIDILGGFWGSLARSILEGRIREDAPGILERVRARLANGEPTEPSLARPR